MSTEQDLLTARIICRAVLPVIKVMIADDPKLKACFDGVDATVCFTAPGPDGPVGAQCHFHDGEMELVPEPGDDADITFRFSSVAKLNGLFTGKTVLPKISGWTNVGLLIKVVRVLLGLTLLMPEKKCKSPEQARLKVKMTLFMISTALSQLNKGGDADMQAWTAKQPERIYQWSVGGADDIACWLKVKAGKSKAGRGFYARRKPFVHMKFNGVEGALPVLSNQIDTVQAMAQGLVDNEGSPEYGGKLGDFMLKIAGLLG
jgi:hypothetical protein